MDKWVKHEKGFTGRDPLVDMVSVASKTMTIAANLVTTNFGGYEYVDIFFNEEEKLVGISSNPNKSGYKIRRPGGSTSYQIQVNSFIKKHNIGRGRYTATYDEDEGLLVFKPIIIEVG